jgi:hypothetical protein
MAPPLISKGASSQHFQRAACVRKLISKPQLNEIAFEFGSHPVLNQHGQASNEMVLTWSLQQNFEN